MLTVTAFKSVTPKEKELFELLLEEVQQELKKEKSNTEEFLSIYTENAIHTFYNPILLEKIKKKKFLIYSFKIKKKQNVIEFLKFDVLVLEQSTKNYFYTKYDDTLPKQIFFFNFIEQFKKIDNVKRKTFTASRL